MAIFAMPYLLKKLIVQFTCTCIQSSTKHPGFEPVSPRKWTLGILRLVVVLKVKLSLRAGATLTPADMAEQCVARC